MQTMPTLQIKITEAQSRKLSLNALARDVTQSDLVRDLIDKLADLQLVSSEPPTTAAPSAGTASSTSSSNLEHIKQVGFATGESAFVAQLRAAASRAVQ